MIDHRSYTHNLSSYEIKAWKNSGLNGIRTHDLCDTGAVLWSHEFVIYPQKVNNANDVFLRSSDVWPFIYSFAFFTFYR